MKIFRTFPSWSVVKPSSVTPEQIFLWHNGNMFWNTDDKETLFITWKPDDKETLFIRWNSDDLRNPVFYHGTLMIKGTLLITGTLFITWNPDDNRNPVYFLEPYEKRNPVYSQEPDDKRNPVNCLEPSWKKEPCFLPGTLMKKRYPVYYMEPWW